MKKGARSRASPGGPPTQNRSNTYRTRVLCAYYLPKRFITTRILPNESATRRKESPLLYQSRGGDSSSFWLQYKPEHSRGTLPGSLGDFRATIRSRVSSHARLYGITHNHRPPRYIFRDTFFFSKTKIGKQSQTYSLHVGANTRQITPTLRTSGYTHFAVGQQPRPPHLLHYVEAAAKKQENETAPGREPCATNDRRGNPPTNHCNVQHSGGSCLV